MAPFFDESCCHGNGGSGFHTGDMGEGESWESVWGLEGNTGDMGQAPWGELGIPSPAEDVEAERDSFRARPGCRKINKLTR